MDIQISLYSQDSIVFRDAYDIVTPYEDLIEFKDVAWILVENQVAYDINGERIFKVETYITEPQFILDDEAVWENKLLNDLDTESYVVDAVSIIMPADSRGGSEWDVTGGTQAYTTFEYSKKTNQDIPWTSLYQLKSASGGWIPEAGAQLTNREVTLGNQDVWANGMTTEKPTANTYTYTATCTNWVSDVEGALGGCGIIQSCNITRGGSTWSFELNIMVVDNYRGW